MFKEQVVIVVVVVVIIVVVIFLVVAIAVVIVAAVIVVVLIIEEHQYCERERERSGGKRKIREAAGADSDHHEVNSYWACHRFFGVRQNTEVSHFCVVAPSVICLTSVLFIPPAVPLRNSTSS